ncbi:hypothetical protein ACRASX_08840 [Flavobacterium sp. TMP13]|uniref:hypothetical protein n=1 Tax=Flavobacterium sp. TMP13 TaxID=3425950 RepID=UPI003D77D597
MKKKFQFRTRKDAFRALLQSSCQFNTQQQVDYWFKEFMRNTLEDEYWVFRLLFFIGSNNFIIEDWFANEVKNKSNWSLNCYYLIEKIDSFY